MARIARKNLKLFASGASDNGQFGSKQTGTGVITSDVETIQALPAWAAGWNSATIGARKFPPLEEMQGLQYVQTYQIAYLLQEGIPEYNNLTTYYTNSVVKKSGTYELYGSLVDDNIGNALTDATKWEFLQDLSLTYQAATTSAAGIVQLAVAANIAAGSTSGNVPTAAQLSTHGFVTGDIKYTSLSTLQAGWVWAAGTIGNATSNATNRANADCEALFTAYWNDAAYNYTGTTATGAALQVYSSAGTLVAKGVSAAADWAANRQIAVPDARDRVLAGRGNMVGSAGRLTGQPNGVNGNALGNSGGLETHSLTEAQNGPHSHTVSPIFVANVAGASATVSGAANNSTTATTSTSGSGSPHNNVQPTLITNIIIKL